MKSKAKLILQWLKTCLDSLYSFILVVAFSRLRGIKQPDTGRTECIVMGNGPSLREGIGWNPNMCYGRAIICVNDFAFSDLYEKLRPTHYVLSDPLYWLPNVPPKIADDRERLFRELSLKTNWSIQLFVPFDCDHSSYWKALKLNEHRHI